MNLFRATTGNHWHPALRVGVVGLVFLLGGACSFLTTSFAALAARTSSLPEEEDDSAKHRTALVAAAQPSRRGTIRPREAAPPRPTAAPHALGCNSLPATARAHHPLTGAGVFQLC